MSDLRPAPVSTLEHADAPRAGCLVLLRGRARAGAATVRYVEISTDGGETWHEATLTGPNEPGDWVDWEHPWTPRRVGWHTLVVRATDARGVVQDAADVVRRVEVG